MRGSALLAWRGFEANSHAIKQNSATESNNAIAIAISDCLCHSGRSHAQMMEKSNAKKILPLLIKRPYCKLRDAAQRSWKWAKTISAAPMAKIPKAARDAFRTTTALDRAAFQRSSSVIKALFGSGTTCRMVDTRRIRDFYESAGRIEILPRACLQT